MDLIKQYFDLVKVSVAGTAISLIISGYLLMDLGQGPQGNTSTSVTSKNYGRYTFSLGFFLLGLVATNNTLETISFKNRRLWVGMSSVALIVIGTFLIRNYVEGIRAKSKTSFFAEKTYVSDSSETKSKEMIDIPILYHFLIFLGGVGLVISISLKEDLSINYVKLITSAVSMIAIFYTGQQVIVNDSGNQGESNRFWFVASWSILALSIAYLT